MRIWFLVVGVEMWKVTLSKSETIWSMEVGVALGGFGSVAVVWKAMVEMDGRTLAQSGP